jgi:hypothetical protein
LLKVVHFFILSQIDSFNFVANSHSLNERLLARFFLADAPHNFCHKFPFFLLYLFFETSPCSYNDSRSHHGGGSGGGSSNLENFNTYGLSVKFLEGDDFFYDFALKIFF